jgi:hypothetical protein
MYVLSVLDVEALMYSDQIAEFDAQIVASDFIHLDATLFDVIGGQADENCISPFFTTIRRCSISKLILTSPDLRTEL